MNISEGQFKQALSMLGHADSNYYNIFTCQCATTAAGVFNSVTGINYSNDFWTTPSSILSRMVGGGSGISLYRNIGSFLARQQRYEDSAKYMGYMFSPSF
ncbi:hypothetical protein [Agarilytica rhodophyticola]|uniref:hypothetical protein n=1 Tax=Agarilytica rhodophyticola TaxID=1737490 RepID=UPI000B341D2D|nr:hypothetical protein [Agarilytica rhodophyticola]